MECEMTGLCTIEKKVSNKRIVVYIYKLFVVLRRCKLHSISKPLINSEFIKRYLNNETTSFPCTVHPLYITLFGVCRN